MRAPCDGDHAATGGELRQRACGDAEEEAVRLTALSSSALWPVVGSVWGYDVNATIEPIHVGLVVPALGAVRGPDFDGCAERHQLRAEECIHVVDVTVEELAQGMALNDAGESLHDSDTQR